MQKTAALRGAVFSLFANLRGRLDAPPPGPARVNLEALALGTHCVLIWTPCLLHWAKMALDMGPQIAPVAP